MRTFWISVGALTLLVIVILINAAYVGRITDEMQNSLQALPVCMQAEEKAQALLDRWKKEKKVLELSVCAADIDELENQIFTLCVAARIGDEKAFEGARALCLLGLSRIQNLERFRFLHIL